VAVIEPNPDDISPERVNAAVRKLWAASGVVCTEVSPTHAIATTDVDPSTLRPGGFVSGPAQFGLADAALWYLTFGALARVEPMALTSELSIRFLRPAIGSTLVARADLERAGRTSIVGTVRIWMSDDPSRIVSTGQGTYSLPRQD